MWYVPMLVLHIAVACATIVMIVYSAYALFREKFQWFGKLAAAIAACAGVETVSGFLLAVLSPNVTVLGVTLHLVSYLSLCLIAEAALLFNSRLVWIG